MMQWALKLCMLLWIGIQVSGCAARSGAPLGDTAERPYINVNGKRYLSGPYGAAADIRHVIAVIETHSAADRLSARGFNLPEASPYAFISVYDYRFPADCGNYHFRYYRGNGARILEYEDRAREDHVVKIRDYLAGPGPFIAPGVWGALDSTSDSPLILLSGNADEGGMALMNGTYQIGWVTMLSSADQERLGREYATALHRASACAAGLGKRPA